MSLPRQYISNYCGHNEYQAMYESKNVARIENHESHIQLRMHEYVGWIKHIKLHTALLIWPHSYCWVHLRALKCHDIWITNSSHRAQPMNPSSITTRSLNSTAACLATHYQKHGWLCQRAPGILPTMATTQSYPIMVTPLPHQKRLIETNSQPCTQAAVVAHPSEMLETIWTR